MDEIFVIGHIRYCWPLKLNHCITGHIRCYRLVWSHKQHVNKLRHYLTYKPTKDHGPVNIIISISDTIILNHTPNGVVHHI